MSVREIVDILARRRAVENMVQNIARSSLTPELKDLCQMVYQILLEYDEGKIRDLWEHNQLGFFIVRIIINQYRSRHSTFYALYRRFSCKAVGIEEYA